MHFLLSLPTLRQCDPSGLSRVNVETLPIQALMELLVADVTPLTKFKDSNDDFLPVEKWPGLWVEPNGDVSVVRWVGAFSGNTMDMQYLPNSIISFLVKKCRLNGFLDLTGLPPGLTFFSVSYNFFSGGVNLKHLPQPLQEIHLNNNALTGSLDLENLPPKLEKASFSVNQFSGCVSLQNLPATMKMLFADTNQISGKIDLSGLPPSLQSLSLGQNALEGSADLSSLSASIKALDLSDNKLSSVSGVECVGRDVSVFLENNAIVVESVRSNDRADIINLSGNTIQSVVDENGTEVESSIVRI